MSMAGMLCLTRHSFQVHKEVPDRKCMNPVNGVSRGSKVEKLLTRTYVRVAVVALQIVGSCFTDNMPHAHAHVTQVRGMIALVNHIFEIMISVSTKTCKATFERTT